MNCTVFGGRGFVGRHLVCYLESLGCSVRVPDRGELSSPDQSLGHVFYCIGLTSDFRSRPFDTVRAHVTVLSDILENGDYESFLYLSSTRIYGRSLKTSEDDILSVSTEDPSDLYNLSKLLGESLCLASKKSQVRVARLSNVVGSGMGSDNFLGSLLKEANSGLIRLETNPESTKDYIFVDDVVRLLWLIANNGQKRIYNVASGSQVTHREWLSILRTFTDCHVETNNKAPFQSFPAIDVQRVKREFEYHPTSVLDVFLKLITTLEI